jgi:hypothetical protein
MVQAPASPTGEASALEEASPAAASPCEEASVFEVASAFDDPSALTEESAREAASPLDASAAREASPPRPLSTRGDASPPGPPSARPDELEEHANVAAARQASPKALISLAPERERSAARVQSAEPRLGAKPATVGERGSRTLSLLGSEGRLGTRIARP